MKWLICILLPISVQGQIQFNSIVHDFGLINEDGDKLTHRFNYMNSGDQVAELIYIQPSCGCTVPHFEKRSVYPGEKSWIEITYDPKNREGNFLKPIELGFLHRGDTSKYVIAVKGFALEGNSPVFADHGAPEAYSIRIAPFQSKIRYADRWNLISQNQFTDFINDLTFVIDQFNFAQVRIQLTIDESQNRKAFDAELARTKKQIQDELVRRNYGAFQVGFITDSIRYDAFDHPWLGSVKLSSVEFNDETLKASLIKRIDDKPISDILSDEALKRVYYANSDVIHYTDLRKKKAKRNTKSDGYERFIRTCVRNALGRKEIWIGVSVQNKLPRKNLRKKILKSVSKDLNKAGIPDSLIHYHPLDTNNKLQEKAILAEYLPFRPDQKPAIDSLEIFDLASYVPNRNWDVENASNKQGLPAYYQPINRSLTYVDTTNPYFVSMMNTVINKIKLGSVIELVIESSASKSPPGANTDNVYVSRRRAERTKLILRTYMLARGLKEEDIRWKETYPLVSGPEYDLQHYLPSYYLYFQYVKIIPIYKTDKVADYIAPYKINFTYQDLEVLNSSTIFQAFINRLAVHIQTFGYVKIIIESSSSRLPTRKLGNPKHLSYHRAQEAKNSIYEEIQKRGINPSKVIITEERTLVQGPEYKNDYDQNADIYEKFQYVKILPGNITEK